MYIFIIMFQPYKDGLPQSTAEAAQRTTIIENLDRIRMKQHIGEVLDTVTSAKYFVPVVAAAGGMLQCVAVCCSMLQHFAECCSMLQCVAVCCSVLQRVAACCSVLQYVAACCSVLQCLTTVWCWLWVVQ